MADLTLRITELDKKCSEIVSNAEKEAAALISDAEHKSEQILFGIQKDIASKRHEEYTKLRKSLELLKQHRLKELEAKKQRIISHFFDKKVAEQIADAVIGRFASDMQKSC